MARGQSNDAGWSDVGDVTNEAPPTPSSNPISLPTPSSNDRGWSDVEARPRAPAPAEQTPLQSFRAGPERVRQFGAMGPEITRGATSGFLGQVGDIEEFARYTAPELVTGRRTPQAQRTTIAPTTEDVSRRLFGERPEGDPGKYRQFGEMMGGVMGLPIRAGGRLLSGITERIGAARRPGEVVEAFGQPEGVTRARDVVRDARPTATAPKFGATVSDVGESIQQNVVRRLDELRATRTAEANRAFSKYYREGARFEDDIIRDYQIAREEIMRQAGGSMSSEMRDVFNKSVDRLRPETIRTEGGGQQIIRPNIEAIELERRKLRDIAQNYGEEGYSAAQRGFAKDLADMLEGIIARRVPASSEAIQIYRQVSEPINRYATALGQKATQRAGEYLPDVPKVDVADLPRQFFRTRDSVQQL
jgi:hypothetical protein